MARRRMIDPNIWTSEDVSKLNMMERLLLIGMFSNADDYGKGKANSVFLRSTVFPYDDIPIKQIEEGLNAISKYISIYIYEIDGSRYYKFSRWTKWQTVQKPQDSMIPEPQVIEENESGMILDSVENDSGLREEKGREENLREKGREEKEVNSLTSDLDSQIIELCKYYETLKPGESLSSQVTTLKIYLQDYGFDWVKEALQINISNKNQFIKSYMLKILTTWKTEGHTSVTTKGNKARALPINRNSFGNYSGQRQYDPDELRKQLLGRGRDVGG